ncbi:MAG: HpcH/HpaI aldolase/citrate lyase family protein [Rhodospirillales bacterium]
MSKEKVLPVWRSLLFVPVNVDKFVDKAHTRGADGIILDLEDSIAPSEKDNARTLVKAAAAKVKRGGGDVLVRINRPWRMAMRDIEASICPDVNALVISKAESPEHVQMIAEVVEDCEAEQGMDVGATKFLVNVEDPKSFMRMADILQAHDRIVAGGAASEDLSAEMGAEASADALYMPKMHAVMSARAAGIVPLGYVGSIADYSDLDGYRAMIERSRKLGFEGSACIHPNQAKILNEVHRPSDEDVAQARKMIDAYDEAHAKGLGAISMDGIMVDIPVVNRARNVMRRYEKITAREEKAKALNG